MKKKTFLLLLLISVGMGVYAQDEDDAAWLKNKLNNAFDKAKSEVVETGRSAPSKSAEFPSINIINLIGFTVKNIFISQAGADNWGKNILRGSLFNKQSTLITLQTPLSEVNRYNIRLEDEDGASYSKRNVVISASTTIEFRVNDLDSGAAASGRY